MPALNFEFSQSEAHASQFWRQTGPNPNHVCLNLLFWLLRTQVLLLDAGNGRRGTVHVQATNHTDSIDQGRLWADAKDATAQSPQSLGGPH